MAEGARLESVYTFIAYRGFESLSLRQILTGPLNPRGFVVSGLQRNVAAGVVWQLARSSLAT